MPEGGDVEMWAGVLAVRRALRRGWRDVGRCNRLRSALRRGCRDVDRCTGTEECLEEGM